MVVAEVDVSDGAVDSQHVLKAVRVEAAEVAVAHKQRLEDVVLRNGLCKLHETKERAERIVRNFEADQRLIGQQSAAQISSSLARNAITGQIQVTTELVVLQPFYHDYDCDCLNCMAFDNFDDILKSLI